MQIIAQTFRSFALLLVIVAVAAGGARAADSAVTPADAARFLAGLQPAAGTPLAKLAEEGNWKQHARFFESAWSRLEAQQLSRIRTWSAKNIGAPQPVLFYMFSGPDFLYADAFFPKADTYVLSGLEPVGNVPDMSKFSRGQLSGELGSLRHSLNSVLNYSFFITQDMKHQLRAGKVNGTLPILYVFLARSGKTVDEMNFVAVDEEGVVHPADEAGLKNPNKGVKILFSDSSGRKHTLYYFTTDLSDSGVKKAGFLKFCEKLGTGNALFKSASYLPHSGGFSTVRDFILQHSAAIVQDDSGVPAHYFKAAEWELHPFGRYIGPISVFPGRYQSKLAQVFRKSTPIDFGIGYRWRPRESNLLLAVKKSPAAAQVQPAQQK